MAKPIIQTGKRKRAIARASLKAGTGKITVNKLTLQHYGSVFLRSRILEPVKLAGERAATLDINVTARGGGMTGQADAIRLAIARALVEHDGTLKSTFLDYDRQLMVADVRRKEPRKPNTHGNARSKRQKSYR